MRMIEPEKLSAVTDGVSAPVIFADDCIHAGHRGGTIALTLVAAIAGPSGEDDTRIAMRRAIVAHLRLSPDAAAKLSRALEGAMALLEKVEKPVS